MSTIFVDNPPPKYINQVKDQVKKLPSNAQSYVKSLFPIVNWLPKYNLIWLSGDLLSALTVGILVIPQSLAYAKIANLPPVYGLYTSFVGVILYPLFGTSKDISIGVSAIMSLMVGQVMGKFLASAQYLSGEWTIADASITLTLFAGFVTLFIGLFRLGDLFHFICQPAIAGFMAGSGITIVINQFNKIFGIPNINTSEAPYLVFGKTLINLNHATVDAAFGISALIYLYTVKYLSQYLMRHYPQYSRCIFFFNTSRAVVVLIFSTLICFMINHFGYFTKSPVSIIGDVPAGFGHMSVPEIKPDLVSLFISDLPGIVILLLMEHGAISTSLGKMTDYKVNMSQEALSVGLTNVLASFFCAYPALGAFSRTAVNSKSGARTPLSSFFVGIIVVLSIYFFTPAFRYISTAALSAIIAHSVTDLISGPSVWRNFWDMNPTELLIFACAYIISLFTRIDISVYVPVILSIIVQLYRSARPQYAVIGKLELDLEQGHDEKHVYEAADTLSHTVFYPNDHPTMGPYLSPIDKDIVCFQPQENLLFQNSSFVLEKLMMEIELSTRRGKPPAEKMGDRPWNNTASIGKGLEKPLLRAVILDLSGVHQMDYSGMEALIDTAVMVERYAGRQISWYFITGDSLHVRKALLFAGFGNQRRDPKTNRFLSDLRHGVQEGGHRPGVEGCCTSHSQNNKLPDDSLDEKKQPTSFEQVVVIEQVQQRRHSHRHLPHLSIGRFHKKGSSSTLDNDHAEMKNDSDTWCYCNNKVGPEVTGKIAAVHDRYPFFFRTLHEAAYAALTRKENDNQSLESIQIMNEKEETASSIEGDSV